MKFVPSLPPATITGVGNRLAVTRLAAIKAAKAVQARTLPPLVTQPHEHHEPRVQESREAAEQRHDPHPEGERRTYCRRFLHLPVLLELRSGVERRHHSQRSGDTTEHIDIEA